MKNIHILPTDKPSRLSDCHDNKLHLDDTKYLKKYQNIYITSDEEIKIGDWYLIEFNGLKITQCTSVEELISIEGRDDCKKIILTTDQDLIKDGIQAISTEFLEWIVKNPSCEEVEIQKVYNDYGETDIFDLVCTPHSFNYQIIIPKEEPCTCTDECLGYLTKTCKRIEEEPKTKCYCGHTSYCDCGPLEPKQETQGYICPQTKKQCDDECCVSAEDCHIEASFGVISDCEPPKQETLEEAAEKYDENDPNDEYGKSYRAFIEGAKWQQERMYSELTDDIIDEWLDYRINNSIKISFKEWFEQFKKK